MKSFLSILLFAIIFILFGCNKDKMQGSPHLQIRIVNATSVTASDAVMGSEIYGSVLPGQTTAYHNFDSFTNAPKLSFYDHENLVELFIGYCGTPAPVFTYLEDGKYVYTITKDPMNSQGFGFTFTKE